MTDFFMIEKNGSGNLDVKSREYRTRDLAKANAPINKASMKVAEKVEVRVNEASGLVPFKKKNKAALGRKPRMALLGIDMKYLDVKDKKYSNSLLRSETYLRRRIRELVAAFGYCSVGVASILGVGALQLAASKYTAQLAAEQAGKNVKLFTTLMELSMKLGGQARSSELAAWELCSKETCQHVKRDDKTMPPWLQAASESMEDEVFEENVLTAVAEKDSDNGVSEEGSVSNDAESGGQAEVVQGGQ